MTNQPIGPACVPTSFWFHLITFAFIAAAFVVGGAYAWHYQFIAQIGGDVPTEQARTYLVALFVGLLGAATQLSIGWAKSVNAQLTGESKLLPCPIEPLGYLLKLVWGAVTGVIANLAAHTGAMVTVSSQTVSPLKPEASALLAFCSGLTAFHMLTWMSGLFRPKNNSSTQGGTTISSTPTPTPPASNPSAPTPPTSGQQGKAPSQ